MRALAALLTVLVLLLVAPAVPAAPARTHVVAEGHTLGKVARRYQVSIDAICTANAIRRRQPLRVGQRLVIPEADDRDGTRAARERRAQPAAAPQAGGSGKAASEVAEPARLEVRGAPPAYYYEPVGPGRFGLRPVIFYLHGRGGDPLSACRQWASVARPNGWLVCPSGPEEREDGGRGWDNDWSRARHMLLNALGALRDRYQRRVQLFGNTLIGFSEGAHVAMNVGVREPRAFNRWLILAADDRYWGGAGLEALQRNRGRVRRVYLITGADDGVVEGTRQVLRWLRGAGVSTRIEVPDDMGHEVPVRSRAKLYADALRWLQRG